MNSTINTIKNRVSVRTYQKAELSKEVLEQIQNYIEHIENPFGVPITFKMLNAEEKTKGYANESTGDIQKVDLGIALYHFELGAKEQGLKGSILQKNPGISTAENVEYIATYQLED